MLNLIIATIVGLALSFIGFLLTESSLALSACLVLAVILRILVTYMENQNDTAAEPTKNT